MRAFKIVKRNKRIAKHDAAGSFLLSTVLKIKSKAGNSTPSAPIYLSSLLSLVSFHLELSVLAMKNLRIKVGRGQ